MDKIVEPMVSVLMITYNHEPYIAQAIEGVLLQQTTFPIELIIGEDCSTDRTLEIVMDYAKRFPDTIRVISSEINIGMCLNDDRVFLASRGKYIAFCEGDDHWHHPQKLQMQVDFLERNIDYVLTNSNYDKFVTSDGSLTTSASKYKQFPEDELIAQVISQEYPIATLTVCLKREVMAEIYQSAPEIFNLVTTFRDLPKWIEVAKHGKFKYFTESLATYNVIQNSASHPIDISQKILFCVDCRMVAHYYIAQLPLKKEVISKCVHKWNRKLLEFAYHSRDVQLAYNAYEDIKMFQLRPTLIEFVLYYGTLNNSFYCLITLCQSVRKNICIFIRRLFFTVT